MGRLIRWLRGPDPYVVHLEAEIAYLRERLDYFQRRGDVALDQLASARVGFPVTTALPAGPFKERDILAETSRIIDNDPDLAHAGQMP